MFFLSSCSEVCPQQQAVPSCSYHCVAVSWCCLVQETHHIPVGRRVIVEMDSWLVQKVLRDARLLLRRKTSLQHAGGPSLQMQLGAILAASLLPARDHAASDQGSAYITGTYGVVAARRPPMWENNQHRMYRNLCCSGYDAYVPARHFTDCEDGVANGAGPWSSTAGVALPPLGTAHNRSEVPIPPQDGPVFFCFDDLTFRFTEKHMDCITLPSQCKTGDF